MWFFLRLYNNMPTSHLFEVIVSMDAGKLLHKKRVSKVASRYERLVQREKEQCATTVSANLWH
jgi:hypothetical protein